jgi:hypothetical protein
MRNNKEYKNYYGKENRNEKYTITKNYLFGVWSGYFGDDWMSGANTD